MSVAETTKLMHDICPLRIGQRVKASPTNKYRDEWCETYVVTMIAWDYQHGAGHGINIGIASGDEIINRYGMTDGWSPDDWLPA